MPANREQVEQIVAAAPNFRNRWEGFLKDWEQEEMSHRDFGAAPLSTMARTAQFGRLGRS